MCDGSRSAEAASLVRPVNEFRAPLRLRHLASTVLHEAQGVRRVPICPAVWLRSPQPIIGPLLFAIDQRRAYGGRFNRASPLNEQSYFGTPVPYVGEHHRCFIKPVSGSPDGSRPRDPGSRSKNRHGAQMELMTETKRDAHSCAGARPSCPHAVRRGGLLRTSPTVVLQAVLS